MLFRWHYRTAAVGPPYNVIGVVLVPVPLPRQRHRDKAEQNGISKSALAQLPDSVERFVDPLQMIWFEMFVNNVHTMNNKYIF